MSPLTHRDAAPSAGADRILTVPNALSALRLAGVPLFLYLTLGAHRDPTRDALAFVVLAVSGVTDYLDGKIARAFHQHSRLGELLDPFADRLYILAVIIALTIRGIVPIWLAGTIVGRDVVLAGFLPVLRHLGYGPLPVHFLGKAATFNLLYAFPLLLLSTQAGTLGRVALAVGWAFALWGLALYWWSGILYGVQVVALARSAGAPGPGGPGPGGPGTGVPGPADGLA